MKVYFTTTQAGDFRLFKKNGSYRIHYMMPQGAGKPIACNSFDLCETNESKALDYFQEWCRAQCGRDCVIFPTWI